MGKVNIGGTSKTGKRRMEYFERQMKALEMRKAGAQYRQIADALGWAGESGAYGAVRKAMEKVCAENVNELRKLENERLDQAQLAIWTEVRKGNIKAITAYLGISKRRAELNGLDAPTKSEITVKDIDTAIEQELESLAAARKASHAAATEDVEPNAGDG